MVASFNHQSLKKRFLKAKVISRTLSALIIAPLILIAVYIGGMFFNALVFLVAACAMMEWSKMLLHKRNTRKVWYAIGILYIFIPSMSLIYIRYLPWGAWLLIWLLVVIWASDIGGYVFGITIGGPKLAPWISPSKTWSGLFGGILSGFCIGIASASMIHTHNLSIYLISLLIPVMAHIGDLSESKIKRLFGIKDSGSLIPGHGGIMDRIDSIATAAPLLAGILYFS